MYPGVRNMKITNKGKTIKIVKKADLSQSGVLTKKPFQVEMVVQNYLVEESQQRTVTIFLNSQPELLPVLMEAKSHLERIFGNSSFYLEIEKDPDEGFEELFIVAKVNKTPEVALSLREQFGREWLIPHHGHLIGKLNLAVESF